MLNGVNTTYVIVIFVAGAVVLAAIYHTILYLHRKTTLLAYYSTYLWFTSFYVLFRFFNPSESDQNYPLSFLNPDETLQMLAFAMYIRFMGLAMDLDPVKEKNSTFFWTKSKYLILAYVIAQMFVEDSDAIPYLYFILKIFIRAYLLFLGLFFLIKMMLKRKERYYYYLAAGAASMIFFGIISSLSNLVQAHMFVLGALAWLMLGFFVDVIFFSSAIGYRIRLESLEKEKALKTVLQQRETLQQKEIEKIQAVYQTKELERMRIAKDLHDDIGATLSSIHLYSELAAKTMENDSSKTKEILAAIENSAQKAMDEMGDIVWAIQSSTDEDKNLSSRIKNYGSSLLALKNISCHYNINPELDKKLVSVEARKNILLIIKEAINNIAKYSHATDASINLNEHEGNVTLSVIDNGTGVDTETVLKGNGLINMQNRCRYLDGTFEIISAQNEGTQIICTIPLTKFSE